MKKSFLAAIALMLSSVAFAQVDSTSQSSPSNDYSKSGTQTDTVSTSQSDTLSNDGSGSSSQMPSSADSVGSNSSGSTGAIATDSTSSGPITDEDIRSYAEVMDSVNAMKQELLGEITDMVKGNPRITVSRYMELSKANGDEAKLTELKATPEEVAFVKEVSDFKNKGAGEISEKFQTLVKEIGVEKYNAIKDQLETDTAMKAKYDAIMAELKKDDDAEPSKSSTGAKTGAKATSSAKSSTK